MKAGDYIKTGFTDFDKEIGGLRKGSLILLGARPGNGRMTFVEDIARNVASDFGYSDSALLFTDKYYRNNKVFKIIKADNSPILADTIQSQALAYNAKLIIVNFETPVDLSAMQKVASKLNMPIMVVTCLSVRHSEDTDEIICPALAEFRETVRNLDKADILMYIHRSNFESPFLELKVLKNSFGETITAGLLLNEDYFKH